MHSFGELLVEYTNRAGISDAELARSIGVQRQTIFRWKEGTVARPRYREDVQHIAEKLRLSPAERDTFLLASGFPPEDPGAVLALSSADTEREAVPAPTAGEAAGVPDAAELPEPLAPPGAPTGVLRRRERLFSQPGTLLGVATLVMLLVAMGGAFLLPRLWPGMAEATPTPVPIELGLPPLTPASGTPSTPATPIVAAEGEKLLLVAPFIGYTSEELRFNVAGRIQEALAAEIVESRLPDVRVAVLPAPVTAQEQARDLLAKTKASAIIWGEYDAGRVRANVTVPSEAETNWINPVDSPGKLAVVINDQVPAAARILALFTLGRLYRQEADLTTALHTFEKALALKPADQTTVAALHFYIGTLLPKVEGIRAGVLSEAIGHFNQGLALEPTWENLLYNRGTAYLGRALLSTAEQADLDAAIADLSAVIARQPQRVDPLLNRGIAYYQRRGPDDLPAAIADFSAAATLAPDDHRPFYHRGLARIRAGEAGAWAADMLQADQLRPNNAAVLNGLCWGYGLWGEAETGLPYCDRAVAIDATGSSLDSRAVAYAQVGKYEMAAADLEGYLSWVKATYPELYTKYRGPQVEEWIAALKGNDNPFTPAVLAGLR